LRINASGKHNRYSDKEQFSLSFHLLSLS